jgi:hypothetical protein
MSWASDRFFASDGLPRMDWHLLSSSATGFNTRTPYRCSRTTVSASKLDLKLHGGAIISIETRSPPEELKYVCRVRRSTLNLRSAARASLSVLMPPDTDTMSTTLVVRSDPKATMAAPPINAHLAADPRRACEIAIEASSIGLDFERLIGSNSQSDSTNRRSKKSGEMTSTCSSRDDDGENEAGGGGVFGGDGGGGGGGGGGGDEAEAD